MALKKKEVVVERQYDMIGLFTIVKGQYRKKEPAVVCEDKETRFIGGYNPNDEETECWYQLMDKENYLTVVCGSDLDMILRGLYNLIVKYNNDRQAYLSAHEVFTSYDDESGKKTKRCNTSKVTTMINKAVEEYYGEYFEDMIEEVERKAIKDLRGKKTEKKVVKKSTKKVHTATKSAEKKVVPKKSPLKNKEVLKTDVVEEEELPFSDEPVKKEPPKKKAVKKVTSKKSAPTKKVPLEKTLRRRPQGSRMHSHPARTGFSGAGIDRSAL